MNKLIAVVGMAGSGKSVATSYLEEKGWNKIYFGGAVYAKMKEEGIEITPESQQKYREKIRKEYGMGAVAIILKDKIKKAIEEGNTVLDGLYSWDEYKILKKDYKNLKTIAIICNKDIRYKRIAERVDRPFNHDEIKARDLTEIENLAKGGPIAYADYFIINNGDFDSYYEQLENILKDIDNKGEI